MEIARWKESFDPERCEVAEIGPFRLVAHPSGFRASGGDWMSVGSAHSVDEARSGAVHALRGHLRTCAAEGLDGRTAAELLEAIGALERAAP